MTPPKPPDIPVSPLPPCPPKTPPKPPDISVPPQKSHNPRLNALAHKTEQPKSLQTRISQEDDERMLGKSNDLPLAIHDFILPPQEAPPNKYGECKQNSNSN